MKRKYFLPVLASFLILSGCSSQKEEETYEPEYDIRHTADPLSDEQKELIMLQGVISDYNTEGRLDEVETYLDSQIQPLPIEIESLPEADSMSDFTELSEEEEKEANATWVGYYKVNDKYKVVFTIYNPTGKSFWLNGRISFQIDPGQVLQNNPAFASYKAAFDDLLPRQSQILNWLYGLNVSYDESTEKDGYYKVTSFDGTWLPSSIAEIQQAAEAVFTKEYLQDTFYYSAFYNDYSVYKEMDGALWILPAGMFDQVTSSEIDTGYIVAAEEDDSYVYVDVLSDSLGEVRPDIRRIALAKTNNGYRLPSSY